MTMLKKGQRRWPGAGLAQGWRRASVKLVQRSHQETMGTGMIILMSSGRSWRIESIWMRAYGEQGGR